MILMVRHGETPQNQDGTARSWSSTGLTPQGRREVQDAAERIQGLTKSLGVSVKQIVSGDLPRTAQTTDILSQVTGAPVHLTPALRTWHLGKYEGADENVAKKAMTQYIQNGKVVPGGESYANYVARYIPIFAGYFHQTDPNDLYVFSSNGRNVRTAHAWVKGGAKGWGDVFDANFVMDDASSVRNGGMALAYPPNTFENIDPHPGMVG